MRRNWMRDVILIPNTGSSLVSWFKAHSPSDVDGDIEKSGVEYYKEVVCRIVAYEACFKRSFLKDFGVYGFDVEKFRRAVLFCANELCVHGVFVYKCKRCSG